jgi:predicted GIY-YIG superfamily endonuclease
VERKYRRMIKTMQAREEAAAEPSPADWSVYIVRCGDDSLYTGVAKDVDARIALHNTGRGAAYTRARRPVRLVYRADGLTRSQALVEEARIKSLPREEKRGLIIASEIR